MLIVNVIHFHNLLIAGFIILVFEYIYWLKSMLIFCWRKRSCVFVGNFEIRIECFKFKSIKFVILTLDELTFSTSIDFKCFELWSLKLLQYPERTFQFTHKFRIFCIDHWLKILFHFRSFQEHKGCLQ